MSTRWSSQDIPNLEGRTFVVTGANGGLGAEITRALAAAGASVVMACRNQATAQTVRDAIVADVPQANLELVALDLGDLDSVRAAADTIGSRHSHLDGLINNAGINGSRGVTAQGFERTFGINHLGPFALTALLFPLVGAAPSPGRIVTVASLAHRWPSPLDWERAAQEKPRSMWLAYGGSKLANLMFHHALHARLIGAQRKTIAVAAHPGVANTNIAVSGTREAGARLAALVYKLGTPLVSQSAAKGALPILHAATHPGHKGGEYMGPGGPFEAMGAPVPAKSSRRALDPAEHVRLWSLSEQLTCIAFDP